MVYPYVYDLEIEARKLPSGWHRVRENPAYYNRLLEGKTLVLRFSGDESFCFYDLGYILHFQRGRSSRFWFASAALACKHSSPKRPLRITSCGFTNLRGGHRRLRLCFSATAVTTERVADRPSDERQRGALRKPAVRRFCGPHSFLRPCHGRQGRESLATQSNSRQIDYLAGTFILVQDAF